MNNDNILDLVKYSADREAVKAEDNATRVFRAGDNVFGEPLIVIRFKGLLYPFVESRVGDIRGLLDAFSDPVFISPLEPVTNDDGFLGDLKDITDTWEAEWNPS